MSCFIIYPSIWKIHSKFLPCGKGVCLFTEGFLAHASPCGCILKRTGMSPYFVADLAAGVAPIGLGLGRIGNFINGELFGRPTDVAWCMVFPHGGPDCRHPSQLYQATLEGLVLFTVLTVIYRRQTPPGTVFWSFISGYGVARFCVEFFPPTR